MAQTILLKRRTADATAPVANDLTTGEIAVNAYSGKLYVKKTDGSVAEISGSGGDAGLIPSATFKRFEYTATNGQTTAPTQVSVPTETSPGTYAATTVYNQVTDANAALGALNQNAQLTAPQGTVSSQALSQAATGQAA